ncbi:histidine phosphatase family protein [Paeniroseomonas aquatica]
MTPSMPSPGGRQRWPDRLWIVRHGESSGNVARDLAHAARLPRIDTLGRDVDVPLSQRGETQASALGRWFAEQPERPDVVLASPYLRARQTAELMQAAGGVAAAPADFILDERLREKEFGILDRLTRYGIESDHPDQAEMRRILGKFYHRPPGGELVRRHPAAARGARYHLAAPCRGAGADRGAPGGGALPALPAGADDRGTDPGDRCRGRRRQCGVTAYGFDAAAGPRGGLVLQTYNFTVPLEAGGAPVTAEADAPRAAR